MRLADIAQAPGQGRDHRHQAASTDPGQALRIDLFNGQRGSIQATGTDGHHHRRQHQGKDHQRGLHRVSPAHRQETTDQGVGDRGQRADPQRGAVIDAEHLLEQAGTGHHARSAVHGKEHQDHQRRDHPQHAGLVVEAVGKEIRQGQRIVGALGVHPQWAGNQTPVQVLADAQTDGNPGFGQATGIQRTGQPHQQPAAHVRGTGAQCRHHRAKRTATEDVIVEALGLPPRPDTDGDHHHQVSQERYQQRGTRSHRHRTTSGQ